MQFLLSFFLNKIISLKKFFFLKLILKHSKNKIIKGIYKSTHLIIESSWSVSDFPSKILGVYEQEVQNKIIQLKNNHNLKYFVNFGSADGYHILGLLKNNIFLKGLAFEKELSGRKIIRKNSIFNKVQKKIKVFKEANFEVVFNQLSTKELKKTLFLIDIEGDEYNIINYKSLNKLKNSFIIIEDHPFKEKNLNIKQNFYKLLKSFYVVKKIKTSNRNPFEYKFFNQLSDHEKWIMISEGRPQTMYWLICTPK